MLARRLNGKYLTPESKQLIDRVEEVKKGDILKDVTALMNQSEEELRALYNSREIEQ